MVTGAQTANAVGGPCASWNLACSRSSLANGLSRRAAATRTAATTATPWRRTPSLATTAAATAVQANAASARQWQASGLCRRRGSSNIVCSAAGGAAAAANGDDGGGSAAAAAARRLLAAAGAFAQAQFLPMALVTAIALGCVAPEAGVAAGALPGLNAVVTTAMFVISGLQLRQGEALQALRSSGAVAWGVASILLVTPLAALAVLRLPLQPPELAIGLAVFVCMPTALSSGITLTTQVGGNVALALLLTVASNALGVFTMPLMLPALLGPAVGGGAAALDPATLLARLVRSVLLPTVLGASVRALVPGAAAAVDARRRELAYLAAALLAIVPWTQVSRTVAGGVALRPESLALVGAAGVGAHLAFLALNAAACRALRLGGADAAAARGVQRAVVLTASVKTLPVAVAVLAALAPVLGPAAGVAVVPCVVAHLSQIVIDSALVARWRAADTAEAAAAAAGGKQDDKES